MHWILNKRADSHQTHCEDAYYYTERDGYVIAAVFDGCSDSVNSHFAAQLHSYALRKILENEWNNWCQAMSRDALSDDDIVLLMGAGTGLQMKASAEALNLTELETLSTALITMYDTKSKRLVCMFMGDGMVWVDGVPQRETSGTQNTPKYLGYLDQMDMEPGFLGDMYRIEVYDNVKSFAVCTDGIDAIVGGHEALEEKIHFLLQDTTLHDSGAMLKRKCNILRQKGATFQDDLTIVRYEAL